MGSESTFWKYIRTKMKGLWEATRVENPAEPGTPDVYFTLYEGSEMGWCELKHAHSWPKRESTIMRFEHYTPQQKNWLRRHHKAGANVSVFVQIEKEYMLFRLPEALKIGELTRVEMVANCRYYWKNSVNPQSLVNALLDKK